MTTHFHHPSDVLRFVHEAEQPCALICVTDIRGGAMRAKGALMAVGKDGAVAGYISNGCVDADIIYQAKAAIQTGEVRRLKYGEGSPFKDIQLPCGGSIELLIVPAPDKQMIGGAVVKFATRQSTKFDHLTNPAAPPAQNDDAYSAVILMFHDHDWEAALLSQALESEAFYIGAMGSARTHKLRCAALAKAGISAINIARVQGPIGLIPSMRDANLLALSTLAQIVKTAQEGERL